MSGLRTWAKVRGRTVSGSLLPSDGFDRSLGCGVAPEKRRDVGGRGIDEQLDDQVREPVNLSMAPDMLEPKMPSIGPR